VPVEDEHCNQGMLLVVTLLQPSHELEHVCLDLGMKRSRVEDNERVAADAKTGSLSALELPERSTDRAHTGGAIVIPIWVGPQRRCGAMASQRRCPTSASCLFSSESIPDECGHVARRCAMLHSISVARRKLGEDCVLDPVLEALGALQMLLYVKCFNLKIWLGLGGCCVRNGV
jgi:hypothetical protein